MVQINTLVCCQCQWFFLTVPPFSLNGTAPNERPVRLWMAVMPGNVYRVYTKNNIVYGWVLENVITRKISLSFTSACFKVRLHTAIKRADFVSRCMLYTYKGNKNAFVRKFRYTIVGEPLSHIHQDTKSARLIAALGKLLAWCTYYYTNHQYWQQITTERPIPCSDKLKRDIEDSWMQEAWTSGSWREARAVFPTDTRSTPATKSSGKMSRVMSSIAPVGALHCRVRRWGSPRVWRIARNCAALPSNRSESNLSVWLLGQLCWGKGEKKVSQRKVVHVFETTTGEWGVEGGSAGKTGFLNRIFVLHDFRAPGTNRTCNLLISGETL